MSAQPSDDPAPFANGDGDARQDPRVRRIDEHLRDALADPDALTAAVGGVTGDLLLLQYRMRQALDKDFLGGPATLQDLEDVMPLMATFSKIVQQVDRFTQLSIKLKSAQQSE